MSKIIITGPESCGKTSLAQYLTQHIPETIVVYEAARHYLSELDRMYDYNDLLAIGQLQMDNEKKFVKHEGNVIFDTDMLTLIIWAKVKFGLSNPQWEHYWRSTHADIYLLCNADLPWVYDPLRENPHDRDELFSMYYSLLTHAGKTIWKVEGQGEQRFLDTLNHLKSHILF